MLKAIKGKIKEHRIKKLECHFELEDLYKEMLVENKGFNKKQLEVRQELLKRSINKRKNLYIYPEKVNV